MGYYSTVLNTPGIRKNKIEEMQADMKRLLKETPRGDWVNIIANIESVGDYGINFYENTGKFYNVEDFFTWLRQYAANGKFQLMSEDGELYGCMFRNGNYHDFYTWEAAEYELEKAGYEATKDNVNIFLLGRQTL